MIYGFTEQEIFLVTIWFFLAFVIQPAYLLKRMKLKHQDRRWVEETYSINHGLMTERVLNNNATIFEYFKPIKQTVDTLPQVLDEKLAGKLQTFRANLIRPIQADMEVMNENVLGFMEGVQEQVDTQIDEFTRERTQLDPGLVDDAYKKMAKKYPWATVAMDYIGKQPQKGGGNERTNQPRRDGGGI